MSSTAEPHRRHGDGARHQRRAGAGTWRVALALVVALAAPVAAAQAPLQAVPRVDLDRYAGRWHEIATIPAFFQRKCARDTEALYRPGDDGMLVVVNSCTRADGGREDIEGRARVVEPVSNARLEVSFIRFLGTWWFVFGGDYVVIGLDPDYRWALVAHPSRKYGWILARAPSLPPALLADLGSRLAAQGYDACDFVLTPQGGSGGPPPVPRLCDVAVAR
jgi:apolipoprotein D and lipocalin family protein